MEIGELTEKALPGLVQELGELQATSILKGDYELKIARQDYFTSKQDQVGTFHLYILYIVLKQVKCLKKIVWVPTVNDEKELLNDRINSSGTRRERFDYFIDRIMSHYFVCLTFFFYFRWSPNFCCSGPGTSFFPWLLRSKGVKIVILIACLAPWRARLVMQLREWKLDLYPQDV